MRTRMYIGRVAAAATAAAAVLAASPAANAVPLGPHGAPLAQTTAKAPIAPTMQTLTTVPVVRGVNITVAGRHYVTNARGQITVPANHGGLALRLRVIPTTLRPNVEVRFLRWYRGRIALAYWYHVQPRFFAAGGVPLDPKKLGGYTIHSSIGMQSAYKGLAPIWLQGTRIVPFTQGLRSKAIEYAIDSVTVDGTNVVNRSQQHFVPQKSQALDVQLLFNTARFTARDAIFHFPVGSGVRITFPDGHSAKEHFGKHGQVVIPDLPRGQYKVKVFGGGVSFLQPVALSRNQDVKLNVITYLDMGVVALFMALIGLAVLRYRRRRNRELALEAAELLSAETEQANPPEPVAAGD
jgi:hypothetical protein